MALNNNFYGSYSSNQVFFTELVRAFEKLGVNIWVASTIEEAVSILKGSRISFSISFSKYKYFIKNLPLYDLFHILNYQWVSDNPLKMNLDSESKWIKYIFIDEEYPIAMKTRAKKDYLFLPLGFLEENVLKPGEKNGRVLVPCKIRNINYLYNDICLSKFSKQMKKFLSEYDRGASFIYSLDSFFSQNDIWDYSDREYFFRLVNEYLRIEKRLWVIEHIKCLPVDVLSEDCGNNINNRCCSFISPINYSDVARFINKYQFVINVDPNYHACIHDRFIKTVSSGTVCVTNENKVINNVTDLTYSFNNANSINKVLENAIIYDKWINQMDAIEDYSWVKSAQVILDDYIKQLEL